ncbi:MAG TPA: amidohydrolase family protein [Actinomycetota bacterium]|nr:amidohydrolase family protein [Actinomycetota bacterium]
MVKASQSSPDEIGIEDLQLVDHHCHGVVAGPLERPEFENLINEGFEPSPAGTSHFDAPIGLAIRQWCAPALDLDPLAPADAYLARRAELGPQEVNRRLLRGSGLGALLIDSGYRSDELLDLPAMGELAGAPVHEVVRIEAVAESVAAEVAEAAGYPAALEAALEKRADAGVGLKTIVAYRSGFAIDPTRPSREEVVHAAGDWLREIEEGRWRLTDPVLLRFGIWSGADVARERGLPLQVHSGFGDPELRIHEANPALLTDLIRSLGELSVNMVFLHCYPYHREAGYLAAVFPHVYFDIGSALNYTGPSARNLLAESLEVAPFSKQLFSSDAFGVPELYYLGAVLFRRALSSILEQWIEEGQCAIEDARRVAEMIGRENALRIYPVQD